MASGKATESMTHEITSDGLSGLSSDQWQRLLVSAIYLLQNTTDPEKDLEYSRWLVGQWQHDQQRILHQQNEQITS